MLMMLADSYVAWTPAELFTGGALGAWWHITDTSTLYQTNDTSTPVTALGQQVGRVTDKSGSGAHATQATAAYRPKLPDAGYRLRSDFSDDVLSATLDSARDMYVSTPYGAYKSQANSETVRLPLNDAQEIIACAPLTAAKEDALYRYFGVDEKYLVVLSQDTTINNMRCYTGGGTTNILFVGANGATVTKGLSLDSDTSYNVSNDGLTAPVAVVYPAELITSTALTKFYCPSNRLTGSIPSLSANTALTEFYWSENLLTGSIPSLSANTKLTFFNCHSNQLTGSIPSLTENTALSRFLCYSNQLTGSIPSLTANTALTTFFCDTNQLTGSIPSLTANTALTVFTCHANQLTGSIPSLSANTALKQIYCHSNQLTGSIPSLTDNTALEYFYCYSNQLTGSIPDLSANTALIQFLCYSNQLTEWTGGTVSNTLGDFQAQNNNLSQAAVDAILKAFVDAGRTTGTRVLNLGGTGNAAPSATGAADKQTLIDRGWTVTTN